MEDRVTILLNYIEQLTELKEKQLNYVEKRHEHNVKQSQIKRDGEIDKIREKLKTIDEKEGEEMQSIHNKYHGKREKLLKLIEETDNHYFKVVSFYEEQNSASERNIQYKYQTQVSHIRNRLQNL
jgi:hypothetical protein